MMSNKPTMSGKKVSFSKQQYNFLLDMQKNEMYSLDRYLAGKLRQYVNVLSKMHFLEMINSDLPALQRRGIDREDCELLVLYFNYLKTITTFLDDVIRQLHKNKNLTIEKFLGELHEIFTVPSSIFIGYNQSQLIEALRLIYNRLKVSLDGILSDSQNKFIEICDACADNPSFLLEHQRQLSYWIDSIKGKPHHLPLKDISTAIPGKSILKKSQEK